MNHLPPELPRGPLGPLPPRDGAFEQVLSSARRRRQRGQAFFGTGVTLVVLALAIAIPMALDGDEAPPLQVAAEGDAGDGSPSVSYPATTTTWVRSGTDSADAGGDSGVDQGGIDPITGIAGSTGPGAVSTLHGTTTLPRSSEPYHLLDAGYLNGTAVDEGGKPLAGLFVYDRSPTQGSASWTATTDADGNYQVPCPTGPVVISGVVLATFAGNHDGDQNWAPVEVEAVGDDDLADACGTGDRTVTTLRPGGVIEGTLLDPSGVAPARDNGRVWGQSVELTGLPWAPPANCHPFCFHIESWTKADRTFRIIGIPPGTHTLWSEQEPDVYTKQSVTVASGKVSKVEVALVPPSGPPTSGPSTTVPSAN